MAVTGLVNPQAFPTTGDTRKHSETALMIVFLTLPYEHYQVGLNKHQQLFNPRSNRAVDSIFGAGRDLLVEAILELAAINSFSRGGLAIKYYQ